MEDINLTRKLKEWASKESSTYLGDFIVQAKLDPDELDKICGQDPEFSLALKHVKLTIAQRLRNKLGKKGYSSTLFNREIAMYDLLLAEFEKNQLRVEQMIKKDLGEETNFVNLVKYIQGLNLNEVEEPDE